MKQLARAAVQQAASNTTGSDCSKVCAFDIQRMKYCALFKLYQKPIELASEWCYPSFEQLEPD